MDKFEKEILRKINEKAEEIGFAPYSKILDVKPRTEQPYNLDNILKFDVLVCRSKTKNIIQCDAYEFIAEEDVEIWHMMYNGKAEYNVKTKCFDMNDICFAYFTKELSKKWLESVAYKINFNGGI